MALLLNTLSLPRCPHCRIDTPYLSKSWEVDSTDAEGQNKRLWRVYRCNKCGRMVLAYASGHNVEVAGVFPSTPTVDEAIPERAREYLSQALNSIHAPAGAIMLTASSVDAMLKEKGYKSGTLYARIEQAAADHLITTEMSAWAHEIRLDANDERHSDPTSPLPVTTDAERAIDFAQALGQFLFVLPSRITRGRKVAKEQQSN